MNRLTHTSYQRGSALIIALVMLLLVSLIAVAGMQGTIVQERMASNLHDREIAFQAAEAALREGERFLLNSAPDIIPNKDGIYDINHADLPTWLAASPRNGEGVRTFSGNFENVNEQPQYYIERIGVTPSGTETEVGTARPPVSFYRVTARGFGATPDTVVVLSSLFRNQ